MAATAAAMMGAAGDTAGNMMGAAGHMNNSRMGTDGNMNGDMMGTAGFNTAGTMGAGPQLPETGMILHQILAIVRGTRLGTLIRGFTPAVV